jgi:hypothetical protein
MRLIIICYMHLLQVEAYIAYSATCITTTSIYITPNSISVALDPILYTLIKLQPFVPSVVTLCSVHAGEVPIETHRVNRRCNIKMS